MVVLSTKSHFFLIERRTILETMVRHPAMNAYIDTQGEDSSSDLSPLLLLYLILGLKDVLVRPQNLLGESPLLTAVNLHPTCCIQCAHSAMVHAYLKIVKRIGDFTRFLLCKLEKKHRKKGQKEIKGLENKEREKQGGEKRKVTKAGQRTKRKRKSARMRRLKIKGGHVIDNIYYILLYTIYIIGYLLYIIILYYIL